MTVRFGRTTMPWKVVERKIGRAGGLKQRTARQREWDQKYGEGQWAVGFVIEGAFVLQEAALDSNYNRSYEEYFAACSSPRSVSSGCLPRRPPSE